MNRIDFDNLVRSGVLTKIEREDGLPCAKTKSGIVITMRTDIIGIPFTAKKTGKKIPEF